MMRRVDLLPERYGLKRRERRSIALVSLVGAGLIFLFVLWWMALGGSINSEKTNLQTAQQRNAALQAQIDELQQFALLEAEVLAKKQALVTVMTGDINWPSLMTQVAMVIPGEVWLENLTASAGQTEGFAPVGTEGAAIRISDETPTGRVQFTGQATSMPSVAEWLIQLGKVDAFSAIWLNSASSSGLAGGAVETFSFDSTIELGAEALSQRYLGELP